MDKLNTIICGIDFSDGSKCALRQAARIAQWKGARLIAVHVLTRNLWEIFPDLPEPEIVAEAKDKLDRLVFAVLGDSHNAEQRVLVGHPFRSVADVVHQESADLLVMGVHGHGALPGVPSPAGALATKCVRKIPAKVLLVRGDQTGDFKYVIHCTDFSKTAALAFDQAIAVARQEGAALEILHAIIRPELAAQGIADAQLFKMLDTETIRLQAKLDMKRYIAPFKAKLEGIDHKISIIEADDTRVKALLDTIEKSDADLVVLGTDGRGAIEGLIMGTTAEKIVSNAPCSVLAIKRKPFPKLW